MSVPLVIKLGGKMLQNDAALAQFFRTVHRLAALRPIALVHGGGDQVQSLLERLGTVSQKRDGQRITPTEQMPIVAGVLAGDVNSQLCAIAAQHGLQSVGLTTQAGAMLKCDIDADRGAVGQPQAGSSHLLQVLLDHDYLPIISSIGIGPDGQRLNINADLAAAAIAQVLHADLILLTDVEGILDHDGQLITSITAAQAPALIRHGVVRDGMVVKLNAALQAALQSRRSIAVAGWHDANALTRLAKGEAAGTRIRY